MAVRRCASNFDMLVTCFNASIWLKSPKRMRFMTRHFLNTLLIASTTIGAAAFNTGANAQEDRLLALARDSAIVAGGARYCKFDPDDIENFTARAEARISSLAKDEYEKILARLEFKNILDAYTVKEPQGGCSDFREVFDRSRRNVQ